MPHFPSWDRIIQNPLLLPSPLSREQPKMHVSLSPAAYQPSILKPTALLPPRKWPIPSPDDSENEDTDGADSDDPYASDSFRMFEFKVRRCARGRSHDWTECPFAHPGEKARRRDPRRFHYSAEICPDFRRTGSCRRGDTCELSHGVFECWLHPARYRTQLCKDGRDCKRRICFFAHTPRQLRIQPPLSGNSRSISSHRCIVCAAAAVSSPTSALIEFPADGQFKGGYSPRSCYQSASTVNRCRLSSLDLFLSRMSYNQAMIADLVGSMDGLDLSRCIGKREYVMKGCTEEGEGDGSGPDLEWVNELVM